jgi:hypothetical protein
MYPAVSAALIKACVLADVVVYEDPKPYLIVGAPVIDLKQFGNMLP